MSNDPIEQSVLDMTLCQVARLYTDYRARYKPVSKSTLQFVDKVVKLFDKYVGEDIPVRDLRGPRHWDTYRCCLLESGLSPVTTGPLFEWPGRLLRSLNRRGLLSWKPDCGLMPDIPVTKKRIPTVGEISKVYAAIGKVQYRGRQIRPAEAFRFRTILVLQYFTAFRVSAVKALLWENVTARSITLVAPKTKRLHSIPMHPILYQHLLKWSRYKGCLKALRIAHQYLTSEVLKRKVFNISSENINAAYRAACELAKVEKMTSHDVRRASITQWTLVGLSSGEIIHGCGVKRSMLPYFAEEEFLRKGLLRLNVPKNFMSKADREKSVMRYAEWKALYMQLSPLERCKLVDFLNSMIQVRED